MDIESSINKNDMSKRRFVKLCMFNTSISVGRDHYNFRFLNGLMFSVDLLYYILIKRYFRPEMLV